MLARVLPASHFQRRVVAITACCASPLKLLNICLPCRFWTAFLLFICPDICRYIGVTGMNGRYIARYAFAGKDVGTRLGAFHSMEQAAQMYDSALIREVGIPSFDVALSSQMSASLPGCLLMTSTCLCIGSYPVWLAT